ncbi:MAG: hypothetical protein Q7S32_04560 [bacterium]|nr:hypothetical protein [bacterium]
MLKALRLAGKLGIGKWSLLVTSGALAGLVGWYWWQTEEVNDLLPIKTSPPRFTEQLRKKFPENKITVEEEKQKPDSGHRKSHLKIKSFYGDERGSIEAIWWNKSKKVRDKVLVILPITGDGDPGKFIARYFSVAEGFDVVQILGASRKGFLDYQEFQSASHLLRVKNVVRDVDYFMQLRVSNYLQTIAWLKEEKGYRDVYVLGISLGAIEGSLVALDVNVRAAVLVMGGGDLAEIVMTSKESFVIRWRLALIESLKKVLGRPLQKDEALQFLRDNFSEADPLRYVGEVNPKKILMISAKYDETIPWKNGLKLWREANQPRLIVFSTTHHGIATYGPAILYHVGRFFSAA